MEQRRKIIIPTGGDPDETLATPHFDAEATLSARPVVPLAEPVSPTPEMAYATASPGANYARRAPVAASSPWKRSTLILIILTAVSVGVASGLAIGFYQTRTKAPAAAAVAQPDASEQQQATVQPAPAQSTRVQEPVVEPQAGAQIPDAPAEKETKESVATKKSSATDAQPDDKQTPARSQPKRDEERATPAVVRERRVDDDDDEYVVRDERDDRRDRRERRREERREGRRHGRDDDSYEPLNVPRRAERVRQDINRIRDIFEGRQP